MNRLAQLGLTLALLLATAAPAVMATPRDLLDAGQLRAQMVIDTPAPRYQRAPLILAVEVATPRWFSRGTRVRDFRIPGAVVLPVSSFASNQTRREGGDTWTVQRWRFRVFPQEAGVLSLPALRVFVSVNADGGVVEGELELRHAPLEIVVPPGAPSDGAWLAASALQLSDRWEGRQERYQIGDAFTRIRRFEADGE